MEDNFKTFYHQYNNLTINFEVVDFTHENFLNSVLSYILKNNNYFLTEINIMGMNYQNFKYFFKNIQDAKKLTFGGVINNDIFNFFFDNAKFKNLKEFSMLENICSFNFISKLNEISENLESLDIKFIEFEYYNLENFNNLKILKINYEEKFVSSKFNFEYVYYSYEKQKKFWLFYKISD